LPGVAVELGNVRRQLDFLDRHGADGVQIGDLELQFTEVLRACLEDRRYQPPGQHGVAGMNDIVRLEAQLPVDGVVPDQGQSGRGAASHLLVLAPGSGLQGRIGPKSQGHQALAGRLALLKVAAAELLNRLFNLLRDLLGKVEAKLDPANLGNRNGQLAVAHFDFDGFRKVGLPDYRAIVEVSDHRAGAKRTFRGFTPGLVESGRECDDEHHPLAKTHHGNLLFEEERIPGEIV
jgi:hypothetical protein